MVDNLNSNDTEYFATKAPDKMLPDLMGKIDGYYKYLQASGRITVWKRSYEYYNRGILRGARLNKGGAENEYTLMNVNHFRSLLQNIKNMTTQQLPSLTPRAANTDYESMAQTIVAAGILDYYINEKKMASFADTCVEDCLIFGEGEIGQIWDTEAGDDYAADPTSGKVYKTGDVLLRNYTPIDIVRDWLAPDSTHHSWKITRDFVNKFDLAAKYPDQAADILAMSIDGFKDYHLRLGYTGNYDTDLIPHFVLYHEKTASVPNGRLTEFLSSELCLFDGQLPYSHIPLYRMAGGEQRGTPFGYTIAFDILPIQEGHDGLSSTIITNQSQFGVQNVWVPSGSNLSVVSLAGGLNLLQSTVKPEGINLTSTPKEIFAFRQELVTDMETISGVNSVARGDPSANLKSGAALALVQSMAIQFNSGVQKSYAQLYSDLGTGIIELLKTFPTTPRNIVISGKNNRSYMATFTKDKFKSIDRVIADLGNPLTRTTAGRVDIADSLLEKGLIKEPEQYIEVLTTGKIEPTYEGPQAEKMLVRSENEQLMEGKPVIAVVLDPHALHIQEHKTVIASPEARQNAAVVANALQHITDHINLLRTTDPALLLAIGQTPIAQPQISAQNPQVQGQSPNPSASEPSSPVGQPAGASPAEVMNPQDPNAEKVAQGQAARMPINPLTKERAPSPATGG